MDLTDMTYEELESLINKMNIHEYDEHKLAELYSRYALDDVITLNIFCQLVGVFAELEMADKVDRKLIAHTSYLISRYSFIDLTQPKSEEISLYYALKANKLDPCDKYHEWIEFVKKGN